MPKMWKLYGASGLIPIPVADTVPISGAQVTMIIALGKIFDLTISRSVAKSIAGVGVAQTVGRTAVSSVLKYIPSRNSSRHDCGCEYSSRNNRGVRMVGCRRFL